MATKRSNKLVPVKAAGLQGKVMSNRDFLSFRFLLEQTGARFEAAQTPLGEEVQLSSCRVFFDEKSVAAQWKKILRICEQHGFQVKDA